MPINPDYPLSPAWPHGEIVEVFPDTFMVTGTNKTHHGGMDYQFSRNMVMVRQGGELTLINSVRLNEQGLAALDALGAVRNIIRLGAFHGRDDTFYKQRYPQAQVWALPGMTYESGLEPDVLMDRPLPIEGAQLFVFASARMSEGALYLNQHGGVLITCDSIQNITDTDEFYNEATTEFYKTHGLIQESNISPVWLAATRTRFDDFEQLLQSFNFSHLITAHGPVLRDRAHVAVKERVRIAFTKGKE